MISFTLVIINFFQAFYTKIVIRATYERGIRFKARWYVVLVQPYIATSLLLITYDISALARFFLHVMSARYHYMSEMHKARFPKPYFDISPSMVIEPFVSIHPLAFRLGKGAICHLENGDRCRWYAMLEDLVKNKKNTYVVYSCTGTMILA